MTIDQVKTLPAPGPAPDAEFDQRAFRRCLSQFATGVNIVSTVVDGVKWGVTANSFSSLSLEPPMVLWSLGRTSRSFGAFQAAEKFAISILSMDQIDVSQQFASSMENKFEGLDWYMGASGVPLMANAIGTLECTTVARHDGGDHVLFVGRVTHFGRGEGEPLIFAQGRYSVAGEHPGSLKRTAPESDEAVVEQPTFSRLVFQAHRALSSTFEDNRREENVTVTQQKILTALFRKGPLSMGEIAEEMFLGERDAVDAAAELTARGLIRSSKGNSYALTDAGRQLRIALGRRLIAFEKERLAGFSRSEIEICRSVLQKLGDG